MIYKVVGPIPRKDEFDFESVKQLVEYEREKRVGPVLQAAEDLGLLAALSPYAIIHPLLTIEHFTNG